VNLQFRRRSIEVKDDVSVGLLVALPPLDNFGDAVDPLLHVLARDRVQKGGQLAQQIAVLTEQNKLITSYFKSVLNNPTSVNIILSAYKI